MEGGGNATLKVLDLGGNDMPTSMVEDVTTVLNMSDELRARRKRRVWKQKFVECRLGCGIPELFRLQQFHHETRDCPCRELPCPLGCGEVMMVRRCTCHPLAPAPPAGRRCV